MSSRGAHSATPTTEERIAGLPAPIEEPHGLRCRSWLFNTDYDLWDYLPRRSQEPSLPQGPQGPSGLRQRIAAIMIAFFTQMLLRIDQQGLWTMTGFESTMNNVLRIASESIHGGRSSLQCMHSEQETFERNRGKKKPDYPFMMGIYFSDVEVLSNTYPILVLIIHKMMSASYHVILSTLGLDFDKLVAETDTPEHAMEILLSNVARLSEVFGLPKEFDRQSEFQHLVNLARRVIGFSVQPRCEMLRAVQIGLPPNLVEIIREIAGMV